MSAGSYRLLSSARTWVAGSARYSSKTASSATCTRRAPYSPSSCAASAAPRPRTTASASGSSERAFVSSSSAERSGPPPGRSSAYTQIPASLDHLGVLEKLNDAAGRLARVLEELAGSLVGAELQAADGLRRPDVLGSQPEVGER